MVVPLIHPSGEILRKNGELVNGVFSKGAKLITVKDGKITNIRAAVDNRSGASTSSDSSDHVYNNIKDAHDVALELQLGIYALVTVGLLGYVAGKKLYAVAKNKRDAIRKARQKGYRIKEAGLIGAFVETADGCYYAK